MKENNGSNSLVLAVTKKYEDNTEPIEKFSQRVADFKN